MLGMFFMLYTNKKAHPLFFYNQDYYSVVCMVKALQIFIASDESDGPVSVLVK